MKEQYIAHLRKADGAPQYLWDHLINVSAFSGQFASKVGLKELGEILGFLHDLGKTSQEFQGYICSATGMIDPDNDDYVDPAVKKGKVDHSSAGAQVIYKYLSDEGPEGLLAAQILGLCVASHHSGLIDCLSPDGEDHFDRRIKKTEKYTHLDEALLAFDDVENRVLDDLFSWGVEKQLLSKLNSLKERNDSKETLVFKYGLLVRFLFSTLIDADRLDTANFESPKDSQLRSHGQYLPWEILIRRLDKKILEFEEKPEKNEVDDLRNQVSESCLSCSSKPRGIYQLTVPTGGGKTLASLRFALNHASYHEMDRIFYIIPYTSIIDQNADEVRKILEDRDKNGRYLDNVVLEHHSNLTPEEESRRHNLLAENWDAPIVFTTQVQFLQALFSPGTRSARRMHQLANSVIIFDEVQTIPIRCVHMFNIALRFLIQACGSTVVLCTATQPLLDKIDPTQRALPVPNDHRMIPDEKELFNKLKRVEVSDRRKTGGWNDEEVADLAEQELRANGSVLIIVNTKNSARSLYKTLNLRKTADLHHLSTNMCPAHRLEVLDTVKKKLTNHQPVICVSTQLIEAGVDIDFGSVIRYLAGFDSIVQAAGRCNRNGKRRLGNVWIVNPSKENVDNLTDIRVGIEVAERILAEFNDTPENFENDRLSLKVMEQYYNYYFYQRKEEMKYLVGRDSPVGREDDLFNLLSCNTISVAEHQRITGSAPTLPLRQSFQTAAKAFYAIDSPTQGVVVPHGEEGEKIIAELCSAFEIEKQYKLLKRAQRYSVNLFPQELNRLEDLHAIHEIQKGTGIFYLDGQYYSNEFGWCEEIVNDMKPLIY